MNLRSQTHHQKLEYAEEQPNVPGSSHFKITPASLSRPQSKQGSDNIGGEGAARQGLRISFTSQTRQRKADTRAPARSRDHEEGRHFERPFPKPDTSDHARS